MAFSSQPLSFDGSSQMEKSYNKTPIVLIDKDITHSPYILKDNDINRISYARSKLQNHQLQYYKYHHEPVSRLKLQMAILEDIIGPRRCMVFKSSNPNVDKKLLLPKNRKQSR